MDVSAMLTEIDDHGFTDTSEDRKVAMLNDALYDASNRENLPFHLTVIDLVFAGDAQPTNLPTNIQTVYDLVFYTDGQPGVTRPLEPMRTDDIDKKGGNIEAVAEPEGYYFVGDALNVYPVPASGSIARLRYYRIPTAMTALTLSASVDFPVHLHRVLVIGALYRLFDMEDDPEQAVRFQQHFENRLSYLSGEKVQQVDRPEYIHPVAGFDDDYWWD